jgi:hypothetical protein
LRANNDSVAAVNADERACRSTERCDVGDAQGVGWLMESAIEYKVGDFDLKTY